MQRNLNSFKDILEDRRNEQSNFMWVSRELKCVVANKQRVKPTPKYHKQEVLQSLKIQEIIKKLSLAHNIAKEDLEEQVRLILDEIGFNKQLTVIRWLGLVLTKICKQVCTGIYINEDSVLKLKSCMGNTPVVFLPSHRSYADFILMSYICFTYNIEIPSIAAGMDFYAMWGMGSILRDTGAFFMRRSFNDDSLYWDTFRHYIHQLVTKGDLPIEFFIEGTRSRTSKSLLPKFGLLAMVLKPFFTSEVPDVLLVPINISYDRVMEDKLFAYELLGVAKPKESTSAFFKSLSLIKERYGNIYVDFAEPISAKKFFANKIDRSIHSLKSIHNQALTHSEKEALSSIAQEIVYTQQKHCVITTFNLIALAFTNIFSGKQISIKFDDLKEEVIYYKNVLKICGALTDVSDNIDKSVRDALIVHKNLVEMNQNLEVCLVDNPVLLNNKDVRKLKAHALSAETMNVAVPMMMLQIYVNPTLHCLINAAILTTILRNSGPRKSVQTSELYGHFHYLRFLLSNDFVMVENREHWEFRLALKNLETLNLANSINGNLCIGENPKLERFLSNILRPFLFAYCLVCRILCNAEEVLFTKKSILIVAQKETEILMHQDNEDVVHPYCLSLDTITNCVHKLISMSAVTKQRINGEVLLEANVPVLKTITLQLETYLLLIKSSNEVEHFQRTKLHLIAKL